MDHLLRDLRTAFRSLRRRPGFAVVVVFTLALGIGANTAVFSVLQGVLLKPLPFSDPERLVRMYQTWEDTETGERQYAFGYLSGPAYIDYRAQTEIFDGVAAFYSYREMGSDLTGGDRPERVVRMPVSSEFFDVLGVPLARGRSFSLQEERAEVALAIISHGLWQRHFAAAEDVLGRTLSLRCGGGRPGTDADAGRRGPRSHRSGPTRAPGPHGPAGGGLDSGESGSRGLQKQPGKQLPLGGCSPGPGCDHRPGAGSNGGDHTGHLRGLQ